MTVFGYFILSILVLFIICTIFVIISLYRSFQSLEVGDKLCTSFNINEHNDLDPETIIKVVSLKRDATGKVESVTFDNGSTLKSFYDYYISNWFILTDD